MTIAGSFRGGIQVDNTLYGAWTGELYAINSDGERTLLSTFEASTGKVFFAANNATTNDIAAVVNNVPYLITSTGATTYPDADAGSPSALCVHTGYFMFGYGNGNIYASDLNSTNINTLNVARTESNPDGVVQLISYQGQLYAFGEKVVEIWGDPVNATGFPLTRVGFNITPGLISPHCVAGWEPEFGHPPIYVGSDNTVRQFRGYVSEKISPPDLDRLIAATVFKNQIEAICYVTGGHAYWQINGPDYSWVYNLNNGKWHERQSHLSTRSVFTRTVPAFDKWLCGSTDSTDLLHIRFDVDTEAGEPLVAKMESLTAKDFPNRVGVHRADFDFVVGVGEATGDDPIETDPTVLIEWSDDGGQSWKGPWWRKLGRQDITQQRVSVYNTGMSGPMGRRWRWTISDPVHVGFVGATMDAAVRTK